MLKKKQLLKALNKVSYNMIVLNISAHQLAFIFVGYVVCPAEKRLLMLFSFLKRNRKKKIMVFFSSCLSVKFHHELLNYIDLPVMCIHVSKIILSNLKF